MTAVDDPILRAKEESGKNHGPVNPDHYLALQAFDISKEFV